MSNPGRVTMNMDGALLARVDETAKALGLNRSAAISMMCASYLEQRRAIEGLIGASRIFSAIEDAESLEQVKLLMKKFAEEDK